MKPNIVEIGSVFGRLTVVAQHPASKTFYTCACSCDGGETIATSSQLFSGRKRSCGCLQRECRAQGRVKDIAPGETFGKLTVVRLHSSKGRRFYLCKCSCDSGKEPIVSGTLLRNGAVRSCGCLRSETSHKLGLLKRTHGMSHTPTYRSWSSMIERCYTPKPRFKNWNGRGIQVCDRLRYSYQEFFNDLGERPYGKTLHRIDNDGHYSCGKCDQCKKNGWPMNLRWATILEQNRSRRNYTGVTKSKRLENFSDDEIRSEFNRRGLQLS